MHVDGTAELPGEESLGDPNLDDLLNLDGVPSGWTPADWTGLQQTLAGTVQATVQAIVEPLIAPLTAKLTDLVDALRHSKSKGEGSNKGPAKYDGTTTWPQYCRLFQSCYAGKPEEEWAVHLHGLLHGIALQHFDTALVQRNVQAKDLSWAEACVIMGAGPFKGQETPDQLRGMLLAMKWTGSASLASYDKFASDFEQVASRSTVDLATQVYLFQQAMPESLRTLIITVSDPGS